MGLHVLPHARHALGQSHSQVPCASVTRPRFSVAVDRRFESCGPRDVGVRFVARVPGQPRNTGQVAWP